MRSAAWAPRVVLMTAASNVAAQALFSQLGFRTTMLEMTRELPSSAPAQDGAAAKKRPAKKR